MPDDHDATVCGGLEEIREMIARSQRMRAALRDGASPEAVDGAMESLVAVRIRHEEISAIDGELLKERDLLIAALRDQQAKRLKNTAIAELAGLNDSSASRRAIALGGTPRTNRR